MNGLALPKDLEATMLPARASTLTGLLTALLVAGCSAPLAPRGSDDSRTLAAITGTARLFYPLDLGSHWRFHRVFTIGMLGSPNPTTRRSRIDHDLVCVETIDGRLYIIDRLTQTDSTAAGPMTYFQWIRNRQDPTGLYEADVDIGSAPACAGDVTRMPAPEDAEWVASSLSRIGDPVEVARIEAELASRLRLAREALQGGPGGVASGELTRLRYPMSVGSTWTIRENPLFTSTVEAFEKLRGPIGDIPAYRVRVDTEGFGPNDRVLSWYSHSGLVGILVHVEIPTASGPLIAEDVIDLEDLSIPRGRF